MLLLLLEPVVGVMRSEADAGAGRCEEVGVGGRGRGDGEEDEGLRVAPATLVVVMKVVEDAGRGSIGTGRSWEKAGAPLVAACWCWDWAARVLELLEVSTPASTGPADTGPGVVG